MFQYLRREVMKQRVSIQKTFWDRTCSTYWLIACGGESERWCHGLAWKTGWMEMLLIEIWNIRREELISGKNMMSTVLNMMRVPSACWHLESFMQLEMHTILSLVSYWLWMLLVWYSWPCWLSVYVTKDRLLKVAVSYWFQDLCFLGLRLAISWQYVKGVSIKVTFGLFSLVRYINLYQPHPNSEVVEILL